MIKRNLYQCRFCGLSDMIKVKNKDCGKCCIGCGTNDYVMARRCGICYRKAQPKRQYHINHYNCHMRATYLARTIFTIGMIITFVVLHTIWRTNNVIDANGPNMELIKYASIAIVITLLYGIYIISTYSKGEYK